MKNLLIIFILWISFPQMQLAQEECGIRFQEQESGLSGSLRGIDLLDERVCWISGTQGTYSYTVDGGESWHPGFVPGAEKLDFRDVHVFSDMHVLLMSCGNGSDSRIYQTTDGGKSWKICYQNTSEKAFFNGIDFWDEKNGILTSDPIGNKPYLLRTKDGGESWMPLQVEVIPDLKEGEFAFAASGTGIITRGKSEIWLLTGGMVSRVFYSSDRGSNWRAFETPIVQGTPSEGIYSFCINGDKAIAVGGSWKRMEERKGNIILSDNNGQGWRLALGAKEVAFKECVEFLGGECYLVTGPTGTALSRDGGENWKQVDKTPFHAMDYHFDTKTGWLVGAKGKLFKMVWTRQGR